MQFVISLQSCILAVRKGERFPRTMQTVNLVITSFNRLVTIMTDEWHFTSACELLFTIRTSERLFTSVISIYYATPKLMTTLIVCTFGNNHEITPEGHAK